jgi:Segregation and condensation complex subunit ScpB
MLRVEAAIFASARPVPREALARLVGETCRFDDLIADLIHELRGRPYDLTLVAGGYALRTKTRFAPAIRAAHPGSEGTMGPSSRVRKPCRADLDAVDRQGRGSAFAPFLAFLDIVEYRRDRSGRKRLGGADYVTPPREEVVFVD